MDYIRNYNLKRAKDVNGKSCGNNIGLIGVSDGQNYRKKLAQLTTILCIYYAITIYTKLF